MSDPLRWWPGKYAECKRIAQLVGEFMPGGDVIEHGGFGIFADLLPRFHVTTARVADGIDICKLPWEDDRFDLGVSARVIELLPPALRPAYLRELLRVSRYRVFLALPLQPELEAIDKVKNTYIWDTSRVWQHPGLRPQDLERLLEGHDVELAFHVESPSATEVAQWEASRELMQALNAVTALRSDGELGLGTPAFLVAEISKAHVMPQVLGTPSLAAH